jgi:hypothetical protein
MSALVGLRAIVISSTANLSPPVIALIEKPDVSKGVKNCSIAGVYRTVPMPAPDLGRVKRVMERVYR